MEILSEIKARVTMRNLLDWYGIQPIRGSNIYRCFCHEDKKPSANIVKGCEKFHCFSCNWTGDIFDVVEHFEKCNRNEAIKILDNRFHLGLYKQLTHNEKLEIAKRQKEREQERAVKEQWERFEKRVCNKIIERLRFWELVQQTTQPNDDEAKAGTWQFRRWFFQSLKQQDKLNWLYHRICGIDFPDGMFNSDVLDLFFGTDKIELLRAVKDGEIKII